MRIKSFLYGLSNRNKIILFIITLITIAAIIYYLKNSNYQLFIAGITISILLFATIPLWLPDSSSPKIFRKIAVFILEFISITYAIWQPILKEWTKDLIKSGKTPSFLKGTPLEQSPTLVFLILIFIIWILNKRLEDKTGMGKNPVSIDEDIPEPDFKEQLINVCESLNEDLRSIDIKTNWSAKLFTPLDAEVEVQTAHGKKREVSDLLKSIKNSKSRLFLVLGDPGSGKSVSLRKLCQDLSNEVQATGKIPIYINLKEWQVDKKWNEKNPPTIQQLNDFILNSIKSRDIVLSKFFDKYYDRLYQTGRLYFVLDSFDEIPAVLDEKENSELIQKLSEIFFKFLKGARTKESQGILSSRIFRKPTSDFQTTTTLEIRPFSEEKIIKALSTSKTYSSEIIKKIFKDRPDLVPTIRNPFMTHLFSEFVEKNPNTLPTNQSELFAVYINNTLEACQDLIEKKQLSNEEVIETTIEIANIIFSKFGLEAKIDDIKSKMSSDYKVEETIEILKFSRIGRIGGGSDNFFSFSHRRFCEYFAIQKIIKSNTSIDLNSIPTDSQWRDALVLYCEIASFELSENVAKFCWQTIVEINNPSDKRSIHCLRFLGDAFKGRVKCIESFRKELGAFTLSQLEHGKNIIVAKITVEIISLLTDEDINKVIVKALDINIDWIKESAIKSCRYISNINQDLKIKVIKYIHDENYIYFFINYGEYKFTFDLSSSFYIIRKYINYKIFDSFCLITLTILTLICTPYAYLAILIFMLIALSFIKPPTYTIYIDSTNEKNKIIKTYNNFYNSYYRVTKKMFLHIGKLLDFILSDSIAGLSRIFLLLFSISLVFLNKINFINPFHLNVYICYLLLGINVFFGLNFSEFLLPHTKFLISYKDIAMGFFHLLIYSLLFYLVSHFNLLKYLYYTYEIILIPAGFVAIYRMVKANIIRIQNYFSMKKIYTQINYYSLKEREYIYNLYASLSLSKYWQGKLITYLELNVTNVIGEWPVSNFLQIKNDGNLIRLAKLEEKWLRINN